MTKKQDSKKLYIDDIAAGLPFFFWFYLFYLCLQICNSHNPIHSTYFLSHENNCNHWWIYFKATQFLRSPFSLLVLNSGQKMTFGLFIDREIRSRGPKNRFSLSHENNLNNLSLQSWNLREILMDFWTIWKLIYFLQFVLFFWNKELFNVWCLKRSFREFHLWYISSRFSTRTFYLHIIKF